VAGCEAEADVGAGYDAGLAGEVERFRQLGGRMKSWRPRKRT